MEHSSNDRVKEQLMSPNSKHRKAFFLNDDLTKLKMAKQLHSQEIAKSALYSKTYS